MSRGWPWLLGCAHHHISGMSSHLCFSSHSLHVRSFIAFHLLCAMCFVFLTLSAHVLGSLVSFNSRYPCCAISTGSTGKLVNNCALGFVGPACVVLSLAWHDEIVALSRVTLALYSLRGRSSVDNRPLTAIMYLGPFASRVFPSSFVFLYSASFRLISS